MAEDNKITSRDGGALRIWLLTDGKPGHRNQLLGLANRLQALAGAEIHWLKSQDYPLPWRRVLLGLPSALANLPPPDMVIAAGSGTHPLLLACRRHLQTLTVLLMRSYFPRHWVDLHIVPQHDSPTPDSRTLITHGVLNNVVPKSQPVSDPRALVLIGGPSKHFHWSDDRVLEQLGLLFSQYPHWQWQLTSSRRTPPALVEELAALDYPQVQYYHHEDTEPGWLPQQLAASRVVWVTPDSGSMLYEALTSGSATGVLSLRPRGKTRGVRSVEQLSREGKVLTLAQREQLMSAPPAAQQGLWEADRAARWLLKIYKGRQL